MATDGIEVRPLRQLTGETSFNQVFFDEAPVPDEYRLGPIDGGWEVAMRMLESERSILSTQRVGGIDVHRLLDRHAGERNPVVRQQLVHAYVRQRLSEFATAPEGRRVGRTLR
jgi:alkylation response protein AidB-like acyl-CoA dehydrogenase